MANQLVGNLGQLLIEMGKKSIESTPKKKEEKESDAPPNAEASTPKKQEQEDATENNTSEKKQENIVAANTKKESFEDIVVGNLGKIFGKTGSSKTTEDIIGKLVTGGVGGGIFGKTDSGKMSEEVISMLTGGVGGGILGSGRSTSQGAMDIAKIAMGKTGLGGGISNVSEHDYEVITQALQDPQLFFKQQAQKILEKKLDGILDGKIAEKIAGIDFKNLAEKQQKIMDIIRGFKYGVYQNEEILDALRDKVSDEILNCSEKMIQKELGKVTGKVKEKIDSVFGQLDDKIGDFTKDFDIQGLIQDKLKTGIDDALSGITGSLKDIGLGGIENDILNDATMGQIKDLISPLADEQQKIIEEVSEQLEEYVEMIEEFEDMVQDFIEDIEKQAMDWLKEQEKMLAEHILSCVNISIGGFADALGDIGSFSFGF